MSQIPISMDTVDRCLSDLENRILPDVETDLVRQWHEFNSNRCSNEIFVPVRIKASSPVKVAWPVISINQTQADPLAMLLDQFGACSNVIVGASGAMLGVRCNYGVGILPSLFGAGIRLMDELQGNLPTSIPMGPESCRRLLDKGEPDLHNGLGAKVFDTAESFLQTMQRYPAIGRYTYLYHPDLQGPMDVAELLWGSDLFTAVYTEPDTVKAFLDLITQTYIAFMDAWERLVKPLPYAVHWNLCHRGRVMIRDDSAMNFSPEHFNEFIRPRDQQLLDRFGGGAIHFCGRGDHYIKILGGMRGVFAVNTSQPHLNDTEVIFRHTIDKGIKLIGFDRQAAQNASAAGRLPGGQVQCF